MKNNTYVGTHDQNLGLIVGTTVGVVVLVLLFIIIASKLCIIIKSNVIYHYFSMLF